MFKRSAKSSKNNLGPRQTLLAERDVGLSFLRKNDNKCNILMARIRSIKPGFFTDDFIAELEPIERLFFIGLFTQADRNGRLEDRHRRLKAQILPFDDVDADEILTRLNAHSERFIIRYEIDGKRYIQIRTFELHQKPHHKEPDSVLPALDKLKTSASTPNKDGVKTVPTPSQSVYSGGFSCGCGFNCKHTLAQPSKKVAQREDPQEFVEWWEAYPSKVGRLAALKIWKKNVHKKVDLKKMLAILEKQKTSDKWTKDGGQFIPNPATYLNQGRWDDEVESPNVGGSNIIGSRPGEDLKKKYGGLAQ